MCTATQWCIPYTYRGYVKKTPPWQRLRGIVVLIQKLSLNSSCGIMIWMRVVPLQNVHAVFVSILRHRKNEVRLFDNRKRRHWEKLPVHHQTWILSDDITSPGAHHRTAHLAPLPTRSRIDLLLTFSSCSCHRIFCHHLS